MKGYKNIGVKKAKLSNTGCSNVGKDRFWSVQNDKKELIKGACSVKSFLPYQSKTV